jgi:hypothetical protein
MLRLARVEAGNEATDLLADPAAFWQSSQRSCQ